MMTFGACHFCGDRLGHVTIFCARCGRPSCSWRCHSQHLAQHTPRAEHSAPRAAEAYQVTRTAAGYDGRTAERPQESPA